MPARPLVTVRPPKDFDIYTAAQVREELKEAIEIKVAGVLIVDLEHVRFIDETGLGVLVGALKRARAHNCQFVVGCSAEPILKIFRISGMDKVFDIRANTEELAEGEEQPG
jgi:anti-sigma B factor antagonist